MRRRGLHLWLAPSDGGHEAEAMYAWKADGMPPDQFSDIDDLNSTFVRSLLGVAQN